MRRIAMAMMLMSGACDDGGAVMEAAETSGGTEGGSGSDESTGGPGGSEGTTDFPTEACALTLYPLDWDSLRDALHSGLCRDMQAEFDSSMWEACRYTVSGVLAEEEERDPDPDRRCALPVTLYEGACAERDRCVNLAVDIDISEHRATEVCGRLYDHACADLGL